MPDVSDALNVPTEYQFGEKVYPLSNLTIEDWAKIRKLAERLYFEGLKARAEFLPEADKKEITKKIMSVTKAELDKEATEYMGALEATIYLTKLMLIHKTPDITDEEVSELLNQDDFVAVQNRVLGIKEKKESTEEKPKADFQ